MMKKRVVVSGIGLVSPLGSDNTLFWKKVVEGDSGIKPVCDPDLDSLQLAGLARVQDFSPKPKWIEYDRQIQFALQAAELAYCDAKLSKENNPYQRSVYLSSSKGGVLSLDQSNAKNFMFNFLNCTPSSKVAEALECKGEVLNFVSACASGAHAITMAARRVEASPDSIVLAGSTEASLSKLILAGFKNMGVLADNEKYSPVEAFKPFDQKRSGFVAGEGAALLVIESLESAQKRGAPIYAEISGGAFGGDSSHLTRFDSTGESVSRTVQQALSHSNLSLSDVDVINLHGTATKENDRMETQAIKNTWKKNRLPYLNATKPITGHLLGASGAIEAVISVLSLFHQSIPPTLNWEDPDPLCDLPMSIERGRKEAIQTAMSLSYGFGGHIGALVFKQL